MEGARRDEIHNYGMPGSKHPNHQTPSPDYTSGDGHKGEKQRWAEFVHSNP